MPAKVFIDGHEGTTGLRIRDWLAWRGDIELLVLPHRERKQPAARRAALEAADVAVLCLPDDAAREAASWAAELGTRVIDASTAHRVDPKWVYGLPELEPGYEQRIRSAERVANPGCYASAFVLLVRPLVDAGAIAADTPLVCHALSGYSGGGRQLIERWENPDRPLTSLPYEAPYALQRVHKHIPEMMHYGRLTKEPYFTPAVGPFRCGMRLQLPLHREMLRVPAGEIAGIFSRRYGEQPFVRVVPYEISTPIEEDTLSPLACNDTNRIEIHVIPHPSGHVLLAALLDNLGKGAAGVAIQNLNLMLGLPHTTGLPG